MHASIIWSTIIIINTIWNGIQCNLGFINSDHSTVAINNNCHLYISDHKTVNINSYYKIYNASTCLTSYSKS